METNNDVLNFLNQMEVYNILTGVELSTFNKIREILIDDFGDVDLDKLLEVLRAVDDLYIDYLRMKVYFDKSLITTLRNEIFDLYDQKMVEKSNNA